MDKLLDPSMMLSLAFCASLGWFLGSVCAGLIRFIVTLLFTLVATYTSTKKE